MLPRDKFAEPMMMNVMHEGRYVDMLDVGLVEEELGWVFDAIPELEDMDVADYRYEDTGDGARIWILFEREFESGMVLTALISVWLGDEVSFRGHLHTESGEELDSIVRTSAEGLSEWLSDIIENGYQLSLF